MKISISTRFKKDEFTFTEFYNKRIHFNRLEILDPNLVNETMDRKPVHWCAIDMFKLVWGGIDVNTEVEQVAQVIKNSICGELTSTTFLIHNHKLDRMIIVLSGVVTQSVPIEIYIAYVGSEDTFDTYMKELNMSPSDYKITHDYIKNS